ncbi:MAG: UPF0223 family protein [Aerococcus sp.]|nr:UPF0223 family protein [Aerococcus sp.]
MAYQYPIDAEWSVADMTTVIQFWNLVEQAYEDQVDVADLLAGYRAFKTVVPMKMDEKRLDRAFEAASGYSVYQTIKQATQTQQKTLKMKK